MAAEIIKQLFKYGARSFVPWFMAGIVFFSNQRSVWAGEEIRIEVALAERGEGLSFFYKCARAYEKEHPGVTIDLYGDVKINDKLRIRILEGSFPEATNAASLNLPALIQNGDILELDGYLDGPNWERDRSWRESFLQGTLDRHTYDGEAYAVGLANHSMGIWYNKKMFRDHQWVPPATWEEFFVLCDQMKAKGIPPLAFQGRYPSYATLILFGAHYQIAGLQAFYDQQHLIPGSFDNPEFIRAAELTQRVALNYFQKGAMGMSNTEAQLQFFLGHTAMVVCGTWLKSEMTGKIPDGFEMGMFNFPSVAEGKGDPSALQSSSGYFFVFANSPHAETAVDFLRFMTSRRMAGLFSRDRDIPTSIKGANIGNLSKAMADVEVMLENSQLTYGKAPGQNYPELDQAWSDNIYHLLVGKVTSSQFAQRMETDAAKIRNRAEHPDQIILNQVWKPSIFLLVLLAAIVYTIVTQIRKLSRAKLPSPQIGTSTLRKINWKMLLIFIVPPVFLYTLFVIKPSAEAFSWSLHQWDGLTDMRFVGLFNFQRILFENDIFWIAFRNNLFIMFIPALFILPTSLFLAVCISRGVKGQKLFRVAYFFPNVLGAAAVALLWVQIYNPQSGLINKLLVKLGNCLEPLPLLHGLGVYLADFEGFAWLSQDYLYWSIIPMLMWGACGFFMILFLAAMESIPVEFYESADIDGAGTLQQFREITFPLIWEQISVATIFMIIGGMKAFEIIWLLTNQSPTRENHVIGTLIVQKLFKNFQVGEATAIAVLLFLIIFFGTVATLRLMKRETIEFA